MRRTTIRQFEVFQKVAEWLSMSKAADMLGLTQPAVSRNIHDLESALDQPLVKIIRKRVTLTPQGELLKKELNHFFRQLDHIHDNLNEHQIIKGSVSVGIMSTFHMAILNLPGFLKQHEQVSLKPSLDMSEHTLERLDNGDIELAIRSFACHNAHVECVKIASHPMYLYAAHDHPLAQKSDLSIEDLRKERLLMSHDDSPQYANTLSLVDQYGFDREQLTPVGDITLVYCSIAEHLGIGLIPSFVETTRDAKRHITRILPDQIHFTMDTFMLYLKDQPLSAAAEALKQHLFSLRQ